MASRRTKPTAPRRTSQLRAGGMGDLARCDEGSLRRPLGEVSLVVAYDSMNRTLGNGPRLDHSSPVRSARIAWIGESSRKGEGRMIAPWALTATETVLLSVV